MKNKDEKLTLKLSGEAIAKAKGIAKARGTSLSRMVEGYFVQIAEPPQAYASEEISPAVRELRGVLRDYRDLDFKKEYGKHLERKYGKC
jgi:hypothetical protein